MATAIRGGGGGGSSSSNSNRSLGGVNSFQILISKRPSLPWAEQETKVLFELTHCLEQQYVSAYRRKLNEGGLQWRRITPLMVL